MNNSPLISVAPMMDWTDRHCRYFHRLIAPHVQLYTEMVTTGALIHGDAERHLRYSEQEHPVILQLGGSDPKDLALSAKMGEDAGYDEINLNCGCPSDRVQRGKIGACLMAEPDLVAECIDSMQNAVSIPVTIKCRIGIDDVEDEPFLRDFISKNAAAGCKTFIIHARKAILEGLSPKENRAIPPLRYDLVKKMKTESPELDIILNGGLSSIEDVCSTLGQTALYFDKAQEATSNKPTQATQQRSQNETMKALDGAMIGRKAYQDPYFLSEIEQTIFGNQQIMPRDEVVARMIPYIEQQQKDHGTPLKSVTRHMLGLFSGQAGAKAWKRHISENAHKTEKAHDLLNAALGLTYSAPEKRIAA